MSERRFTRREFIKTSAAGLLGISLAACTGQATEAPNLPPVTQAPTSTPIEVIKEKEVIITVEVASGYHESPLLKARVEAGKLPPLSERLPEAPLVLGGREAIGVYGGEIRTSIFDQFFFISTYDLNAERCLVFSDHDLRTIIPNILESYQVSPDGREWTFRLRRGMKWSDGEPVTAEDVRFGWEDMLTDPDLGVWGVDFFFRFGGELMKVEIMDELTLKFTFARTFGAFAIYMTRRHAAADILWPSHYLKQFHRKYTDQAVLDQQAQQLGVGSWVELFWNKAAWGAGIWQAGPDWKEFPSLSPWIIVSNPQSGLYLWERNPYYWKVDQVGNQLPYIDTLRFDYVQTPDTLKLKLIQNELDLVGAMDVSINDYPYYKENESKGNFQVGDYLSCLNDRYILFPQFYVADDPILTEIVNHPNFVKALSVAIDREEVNNSLFYGLARVGQASPMPGSMYYKEKYAAAWAQYDPDLANQLLDEMGLDQRDPQGFRIRPDGKRLSYLIEHTGERIGPAAGKYTEMIKSYWRDLDIEAEAKQIDSALYEERFYGASIQCAIWHQDRVTDMLMPIEMNWFIPINFSQGGASSKWAEWYNAPDKQAEGLIKPPDHIIQLYDWYDQMQEAVSEEERLTYGLKIFDWLAENPLAIGLVVECPAPLLFNKNMRNLPRPRVPVGWDSFGLSTYHPEAFYYVGGQRA